MRSGEISPWYHDLRVAGSVAYLWLRGADVSTSGFYFGISGTSLILTEFSTDKLSAFRVR